MSSNKKAPLKDPKRDPQVDKEGQFQRDQKHRSPDRPGTPAEDSQYIEKLISVRRVTKVVKGGKNMRFSALVIVGDGKGRVAFANAKAREVPDAIKKASYKAKKKLTKVPLKFGRTIHHDVSFYTGASRVCIRTAQQGTGVISGGSMRAMFEALGVQDVVSKSIGTNNSFNVLRSTFKALTSTESPRMLAKRRGMTINEINQRRKVLLTKKFDEDYTDEVE